MKIGWKLNSIFNLDTTADPSRTYGSQYSTTNNNEENVDFDNNILHLKFQHRCTRKYLWIKIHQWKKWICWSTMHNHVITFIISFSSFTIKTFTISSTFSIISFRIFILSYSSSIVSFKSFNTFIKWWYCFITAKISKLRIWSL